MIHRLKSRIAYPPVLLAGLLLALAVACTQDAIPPPTPSSPATEPTPVRSAAETSEPPRLKAVDPFVAGGRFDAVQRRGHLVCANNINVAGFGAIDPDGNTVSFDIDLCRAIAAAVLGDPDALELRPTVAAARGPAIQSGEVYVMSRNTTCTSSRDAQWGNFAPTMFYDGQGFMVLKSLGVTSLPELDGASVCVQQGTTTELNLQDYINQNDLDISILTW